ncbi:MAG: hypothetical protein U1D30_14760 [Planctomycetota bacterium]
MLRTNWIRIIPVVGSLLFLGALDQQLHGFSRLCFAEESPLSACKEACSKAKCPACPDATAQKTANCSSGSCGNCTAETCEGCPLTDAKDGSCKGCPNANEDVCEECPFLKAKKRNSPHPALSQGERVNNCPFNSQGERVGECPLNSQGEKVEECPFLKANPSKGEACTLAEKNQDPCQGCSKAQAEGKVPTPCGMQLSLDSYGSICDGECDDSPPGSHLTNGGFTSQVEPRTKKSPCSACDGNQERFADLSSVTSLPLLNLLTGAGKNLAFAWSVWASRVPSLELEIAADLPEFHGSAFAAHSSNGSSMAQIPTGAPIAVLLPDGSGVLVLTGGVPQEDVASIPFVVEIAELWHAEEGSRCLLPRTKRRRRSLFLNGPPPRRTNARSRSVSMSTLAEQKTMSISRNCTRKNTPKTGPSEGPRPRRTRLLDRALAEKYPAATGLRRSERPFLCSWNPLGGHEELETSPCRLREDAPAPFAVFQANYRSADWEA